MSLHSPSELEVEEAANASENVKQNISSIMSFITNNMKRFLTVVILNFYFITADLNLHYTFYLWYLEIILAKLYCIKIIREILRFGG